MAILVLIQIVSTITYGQNSASLTGRTQDCFAGRMIHPAKVDIYIFDSAKSTEIQRMLNDLRKQAATGNEQNVTNFFESYDRLKRAVRKTTALGHIQSDEAGRFSFDSLKSETNIFLFGFAEREDDPAYYASASVKIESGKNSVTLDFNQGITCNSR